MNIIQINPEHLYLIEGIKRLYVNRGLTYGWKSDINKQHDFGHWNNLIFSNSYNLPTDLSDTVYFKRCPEIQAIWEIITSVIGERSLFRAYVNGYTYGTDAYAHQDDTWMHKMGGVSSETAIVYLNEKWDKDWGGETVIFDDDDEIEFSVLPKYGRIILFDSNKWHAARPLTRACDKLRSVLVFKTMDKKLESKEVEFIKDFTKNIQHSNKTFFEHLFNTLLILENMNKTWAPVSRDCALAGLYHAVYDTEFFKHGKDKPSRETIRELIGTDAESLVYEFCTLTDRFNTIVTGNGRNYDFEFQKRLAQIEYANLLDQNQDNRHSERLKVLAQLINHLQGNT